MSPERWTAVDAYFEDRLGGSDPALEAALARSEAAGLPAISVSPLQGKLLEMLARSVDARRILEVGTLGGYSTIWMARALPAGGRLIALEAEPGHAAVARANIADAGVADQVEVRVGLAAETMRRLIEEGAGPFDLVFIDADKVNTADYFGWALDLCRRGSLILVDNVVRGGAVADPERDDASIEGVRRFVERVAAEPRGDGNGGAVGWKQGIRRVRASVGDGGDDRPVNEGGGEVCPHVPRGGRAVLGRRARAGNGWRAPP